MNGRLRSILILVSSFFVLGGFAYLVGHGFRDKLVVAASARLPNVLILSFCSLRLEHLRAYNPAARPLPTLDRFFKESVVFQDAVNGLPWTNITNFIDVGAIRDLGYGHVKRKSLRIPAVPINKHTPQNEANVKLNFANEDVRTYELNYEAGFDQLRDLILQSAGQPFFTSVHIKYLHFPLIDTVNQKDVWKKRFSPESVAALERYLKDPLAYPEKAPLFLTLFADPKMVRGNPVIARYAPDHRRVRIGQIYQMLADEDLLANWRRSTDFAVDLKILNEAYYLKLDNLDDQLSEVLALYGDLDLKRNTIVIVTGDHGESFMENERFLHAHSVHENQIRYPMAVRVPALELNRSEVINEQYNMAAHDSLIKTLVSRSINLGRFRTEVEKLGRHVFLRNCSGTVSGVRTSRSLKLVADLDGYRMYDLKRDPTESNDIKSERPEEYFALKAEFMQLSLQSRNLFACENEVDPFEGEKPQLRVKPEFDASI